MSYITDFPNGVSSFGVPAAGASNSSFVGFGDTYFVDGTSGSDLQDGKSVNTAKATIQAAVTLQIANASGRGDTIYVMPGTYTESITGDLSQCRLLGYHPFSVRVTPTDGHAYSGNLHDAMISGFMFDNGSSTNQDYAAVRCTTVEDSVITNCLFGKQGGEDTDSVGLMLGTHTTASTTVKFHRSVFSNNQILANGGGNTFDYGFGMCSGGGDATNANSRTMWNSRIENNIISGRKQGIRIVGNHNGSYGTIIKDNVIGGATESNGETSGSGIYQYDNTSPGIGRIWIINNFITSKTDAIEGSSGQMTQGNIVALGASGTGTPAKETA